MSPQNKLFLLIFFFFIQWQLVAITVPQSPNKLDKQGRKTGRWTVLCDSTKQYTVDINQAAYYRLIKYKAGLPVGKVYDYHLSGQIATISILQSDNPDIPNGLVTSYDQDGNKREVYNYQNGILNGLQTLWKEDGSYALCNYVNGTAGPWTFWYDNKSKWKEGSLINGKEEGKWTFWYRTGKKWKEGAFHNGNEEGPWIIWWANGWKQAQGEYLNGEKNGFWKEWSIDFAYAEGTYLNGKKTGDWYTKPSD